VDDIEDEEDIDAESETTNKIRGQGDAI